MSSRRSGKGSNGAASGRWNPGGQLLCGCRPRYGEDALPTEIDRHEVQRLLAAGAQLVDVMPDAEWDESHIAGAVHVPLKELRDLAPARLDTDRPVIVYCYDSL